MNHKDYREQERLLKIEDDEVYSQRLATLPPDTAMVMIPLMSHVAEVTCPEASESTQRLAALRLHHREATLQWLEEHTDRYLPGQVAPEARTQERTKPAMFLQEHVLLLQHLKEHPDMGMTDHYKALNVKPTNGNRIKAKLEAEELIVITGSIATKGRYKTVYSLTAKGEEFLRHAKS